MSPRGNGSRLSRAGFVVALILIVSACSPSGKDGSAGRSTTTLHGTPALTLPGLVAPPRSHKVLFSGEQKDVESAFRALLADFTREDVDAAWSSEAVHSVTKSQLRSFMNSYRLRLFRINNIFVNGTDATIDYENAIVGRNVNSDATTTVLGQRDIWKKVDGHWKFVSDIAFTPGIPSDLTAVILTLRDHQPIAVPAPLPTSDFAFLLKNTGRAAKGLYMFRIPPKLPLSRLLAVGNAVAASRDTAGTVFPHGIVEMGATADVASHRTGTMVFSKRLAPGRYALLSRAGNDGNPLPRESAVFTIK